MTQLTLLLPTLWRGLFVVAVLVVVVVSLLPQSQLQDIDFVGNDKLMHFIAYFVLMAFAVQLQDKRAQWPNAALGLLLLGIAIEYLQQRSGMRRADIRDVYANTLGVLSGTVLAYTPARYWLRVLDRKLAGGRAKPTPP
jgi:VanZ family protein